MSTAGNFLLELRHVLLARGRAAGRAAAAPAARPRRILASLPRVRRAHVSRPRCSGRFPLCENISIDYAVLEKADKVSGIAGGDFGWNDVGSWNAVYELLPRDAQGNVVIHDSVLVDSHNNFVDARGKTVALLGVSDLIVVDTPDALLVASRGRAQGVGEILKQLEERKREDLL